MNNKHLNIIFSVLIWFSILSIFVGIVSLIMCGDPFKYGVPLLRVLIAGFLTYRHRFKILSEEE